MRINNENLLDGVSTSLGADWVSEVLYLGHISQYSIQLVFTGTPDGVFKLQCSNDQGHPNAQSKAEQSADVVNWTDIAGSSQIVTDAGDLTYNSENVGYLWVRVVWVYNASTGTLSSVRANVKGV